MLSDAPDHYAREEEELHEQYARGELTRKELDAELRYLRQCYRAEQEEQRRSDYEERYYRNGGY